MISLDAKNLINSIPLLEQLNSPKEEYKISIAYGRVYLINLSLILLFL